jgi:uncharacterized protein YecE (DUF72 family)
MTAKKGQLRIGTSGYQYDHWKGIFYPRDIPKSRWFGHYARHFDTVEINNTFYNLPKPKTFDDWREAAPENFCYVLKYSRFGTHIKRLKDPDDHVNKFLEAATHLRGKLGPILVQLPPKWNPDLERLSDFLKVTPRKYRWAVEFRDKKWLCDEAYGILRKHNVALCVHDLIENHPREVTANWMYLRYHGVNYAGCYSPQALSAEARRIRDYLADGLDVFAYFNNDAEGYAVQNAMDLRRYVLEK